MKKVNILLLVLFIGFISWSQGEVSEIKIDEIQQRLDKGETPKTIMRSGISMESLYGKIYGGGYIFYFFEKDSSGLTIGKEDLKYKEYKIEGKIYWGCRDTLVKVTETKIGSGKANTQRIHDHRCVLYDVDNETWLKSAADLCILYRGGGYNDWYLPSKDELHEAYMKLAYTSKVEFGRKNYWTSSEKNNQFAWVENMATGHREFEFSGQSYFRKFYARHVRPIRNFK